MMNGSNQTITAQLLQQIRTGSSKERIDSACSLRGLIRRSRPEMPVATLLPTLIQALEDDDDDVRECVAACIEEMGPAGSQAIPALISRIKAHHRYYFAEAAVGVGLAAVPALTKLLDDPDATVRRIAAWGLGSPQLSRGPQRHAATGAQHRLPG